MRGLDPEQTRAARPQVVVKKYANRRLYDTESSTYITLDDLAAMVRDGRDFVVYDARTGDDITRPVLTQVIMEEETRGRSILPTSFLRQLIGFYGDSLQGMVPDYLDQMMIRFSSETAAPPGAGAVPAGSPVVAGAPDSDRAVPAPAVAAEEALLAHASRVFAPVLAARQVQDAERHRPTREELQAEIDTLRLEIERLRRG